MKLITSTFLFFLMTSATLFGQSLSFNVTTISPLSAASNDNIFAIWITNSTGTYVNTINRQGTTRISDFVYWKASATNGTSNTDGMTGATLASHNQLTNPTGGATRKPFTWNCKDRSGNIVSDGTYTINVEFKEENSATQRATYTFVKGNSSTTTVTPVVTNTYFTSPTLSYTAPTTPVPQITTQTDYVINKKNYNLAVYYDASVGLVSGQLLDLKGAAVTQKYTSVRSGELNLKTNNLRGIYLLRIIDSQNHITIKKVAL